MAFKEISLVLSTSDQDVIEVEADRQGIAKLQVANNDSSNRTFTLKHYKADGATTVTLRDAFAVNTKSVIEIPPITMNEGDKIIALASVNSVVVISGAFHDTAKAVPFAVAGLDGTDPGYPWTFRAKTDVEEPDAVGDLNFNHGTLSSVTKIVLSAESAGAGNPDLSDVIESWDDLGESANRGRLLLKNRNAPSQTVEFRLTGDVTFHDDTIDWYELDVEFIGGPGLATDAQLSVQFYDAGEEGAAGVTGASALTKVDVVDTDDGDPSTDYEDGAEIDGVTIEANMLVLRASSSDPELNGVYVVSVSGAASRHSDFDDFDDLPGSEFNVISGTTYGGTKWRCNDEKGGTIDTDPVTIEQITSMDGAQNLADVADAPTAFSNIKQAATDIATGVTRYSTIPEAKALALSTVAMTPDGVGAAMTMAGQGRLTLESGVPVSTSDQTAKSTIYWAPYIGQKFPWYDGSNLRLIDAGGELSLALDSDSGHTGYHQSGKNFDLFLVVDSGTPRLVSGPAWSSDTARGYSLSRIQGIRTNAATMTVRFGTGSGDTLLIAENQATLVGTFRASANGQTQIKFGGTGAGGSEAWLGIWNEFNREQVRLISRDSTSSWSYASSTWRPKNNSTANRITVVSGSDACPIYVINHVRSGPPASSISLIGVGKNITNGNSTFSSVLETGPGVTMSMNHAVDLFDVALGYNFYQAVESANVGTVGYSSVGSVPIEALWSY